MTLFSIHALNDPNFAELIKHDELRSCVYSRTSANNSLRDIAKLFNMSKTNLDKRKGCPAKCSVRIGRDKWNIQATHDAFQRTQHAWISNENQRNLHGYKTRNSCTSYQNVGDSKIQAVQISRAGRYHPENITRLVGYEVNYITMTILYYNSKSNQGL